MAADITQKQNKKKGSMSVKKKTPEGLWMIASLLGNAIIMDMGKQPRTKTQLAKQNKTK